MVEKVVKVQNQNQKPIQKDFPRPTNTHIHQKKKSMMFIQKQLQLPKVPNMVNIKQKTMNIKQKTENTDKDE